MRFTILAIATMLVAPLMVDASNQTAASCLGQGVYHPHLRHPTTFPPLTDTSIPDYADRQLKPKSSKSDPGTKVASKKDSKNSKGTVSTCPRNNCKEGRVQVCRYTERTTSYSTVCLVPKAAKRVLLQDNDAYCGRCTSSPIQTVYVKRTATFDILELENFPENAITWNVSGSTRITHLTAEVPASQALSLEELLQSPAPAASAVPGKTSLRLVYSGSTTSSNAMKLHLVLPSRVEQLCISGNCRPVLCPLSDDFDPKAPAALSAAPSNNQLLFGESTDCTIVKPEKWDEWAVEHFGTVEALDAQYFADPDNDGLSNIVEYYGRAVLSTFLPLNEDDSSRRLALFPIIVLPSGFDPWKPDTDGDLLLDSFEWKYGLDATVKDDLNSDEDGDGLTLFEEQKYGTSPFQADTDGDGYSDKDEIGRGSNPLNDLSIPPNPTTPSGSSGSELVNVKLTVGDHSGSHSERYNMIVGSVEHQAPTYGEVETATYAFRKGSYEIELVHRGSNLATPDYDYRARVEPDSDSTFIVEVRDPFGILGDHYESSSFYAKGKKAFLDIKCKPSDKCCFSTCEECNQQGDCEWDGDNKACEVFIPILDGFKDSVNDCACTKCKAWAATELSNLAWIQQLPQCPCNVQVNSRSLSILGESSVVWVDDSNCRPGTNCGKYHPEATGCIRAPGPVSPHGQQCCYNAAGQIFPHGDRSAGTADKEVGKWNNLIDHWIADVQTFNNCCQFCEVESYCEMYIGNTDGTQGARSDPRECTAVECQASSGESGTCVVDGDACQYKTESSATCPASMKCCYVPNTLTCTGPAGEQGECVEACSEPGKMVEPQKCDAKPGTECCYTPTPTLAAKLVGPPCQSSTAVGICIRDTTCADHGGNSPISDLCPEFKGDLSDVKCCFGLEQDEVEYRVNGRQCPSYDPLAVKPILGNGDTTFLVVPVKEEHLQDPAYAAYEPNEKDNTMTFRLACAFDAMQSAANEEGVPLKINSAFRTFERQQYFKDCENNCRADCDSYNATSKKCNPAADPGTSQHGWGKALDIQVGDLTLAASQTIHNWLQTHGKEFGFFELLDPPEPWHWDFYGTTSKWVPNEGSSPIPTIQSCTGPLGEPGECVEKCLETGNVVELGKCDAKPGTECCYTPSPVENAEEEHDWIRAIIDCNQDRKWCARGKGAEGWDSDVEDPVFRSHEAARQRKPTLDSNPDLLQRLQQVGTEKNIPLPILLALASRESAFGALLSKSWTLDGVKVNCDVGWGDPQVSRECNNASYQQECWGYGIFQLDKCWSSAKIQQAIDDDGSDGITLIRFAADHFLQCYTDVKEKFKDGKNLDQQDVENGLSWNDAFILKGAITCYNLGVRGVQTITSMDFGSANNDYGSDVMTQAMWFFKELGGMQPTDPTKPDPTAIPVPSGECPSYEGYVFWAGYDSLYNDIRQLPDASVSDIVAACTDDESCKGINTNGYLKNAILPSWAWFTFPSAGTCDGLYIKKPNEPYVVNGDALTAIEAENLEWIIRWTIPNFGLSAYDTVQRYVSPGVFWSLREGILNLEDENPFRHSICGGSNTFVPPTDTGTGICGLKSDGNLEEWQVGIAGVQVNYVYASQKDEVEARARAVYKDNLGFALSQSAQQAGYKPGSTVHDGIIGSTDEYLRTAWLAMSHLVGYYMKGPDVFYNCYLREAPACWCYGDYKCNDNAFSRFAATAADALKSLDDTAILIQSLYDPNTSPALSSPKLCNGPNLEAGICIDEAACDSSHMSVESSSCEVTKKCCIQNGLSPLSHIVGPPAKYQSRAAWGAELTECKESHTRLTSNNNIKITIHHTAGSPTATVRSIQEHHMDDNGWSDIGYNFLIGPDGTVYQGRPYVSDWDNEHSSTIWPSDITTELIQGAHSGTKGISPNQNIDNIGISLLGCFESGGCHYSSGNVVPESELIRWNNQYTALVDFLAYLSSSYGIQLAHKVNLFGHRDILGCETYDCPGSKFYAMMSAKTLQEDVASRMPPE